MIKLLHTFTPNPVLLDLNFITIYWYGFFIVLGIVSALLVIFKIGSHFKIHKDDIFDLVFWLIVWGIVGARIYDIFLQLPYYLDRPWQMLEIWKGGLAIHGSIIAGLLYIYYFSRKKNINFFKLSSLIVPGLALGQALGRFGNYFNQELFGLPTSLPWGIPIHILNRPSNFITYQYFHPTFLYESIGNFIIFIVLIVLYRNFLKNIDNDFFYVWSTGLYVILYSVLRFFLEFIRIDYAPSLLGLRWPQIMSLVLIFFSLIILLKYKNVSHKIKKG